MTFFNFSNKFGLKMVQISPKFDQIWAFHIFFPGKYKDWLKKILTLFIQNLLSFLMVPSTISPYIANYTIFALELATKGEKCAFEIWMNQK